MNLELLTTPAESPLSRLSTATSPNSTDIETREKLRWAFPLLRESNVVRLLDVGSAGGRMANAAALRGFRVTALSVSDQAIERGRRNDMTGAVKYIRGEVHRIALDSSSFDAILAFDIFQKTARPDLAIKEFSRLLKPDGILLFRACNRNVFTWLLSHLMGKKFLNDPDRSQPEPVHFIRPHEFEKYCALANLEVLNWEGVRLCLTNPIFRMISHSITSLNADSKRASSLRLFYCGVARKRW